MLQAVFQRLIDRSGQASIGHFDFAVKTFLMAQQAIAELLAHALHLVHHVFEIFNHLRQGLRLKLQGLEGFLPLVAERKRAQMGRNQGV